MQSLMWWAKPTAISCRVRWLRYRSPLVLLRRAYTLDKSRDEFKDILANARARRRSPKKKVGTIECHQPTTRSTLVPQVDGARPLDKVPRASVETTFTNMNQRPITPTTSPTTCEEITTDTPETKASSDSAVLSNVDFKNILAIARRTSAVPARGRRWNPRLRRALAPGAIPHGLGVAELYPTM